MNTMQRQLCTQFNEWMQFYADQDRLIEATQLICSSAFVWQYAKSQNTKRLRTTIHSLNAPILIIRCLNAFKISTVNAAANACGHQHFAPITDVHDRPRPPVKSSGSRCRRPRLPATRCAFIHSNRTLPDFITAYVHSTNHDMSSCELWVVWRRNGICAL